MAKTCFIIKITIEFGATGLHDLRKREQIIYDALVQEQHPTNISLHPTAIKGYSTSHITVMWFRYCVDKSEAEAVGNRWSGIISQLPFAPLTTKQALSVEERSL